MKTCWHCGSHFTDKFPSIEQCMVCWNRYKIARCADPASAFGIAYYIAQDVRRVQVAGQSPNPET